jgi:hypothetical protein
MCINEHIKNAHIAAEKAAASLGYSSFNELNNSDNEHDKQIARSAFDGAFFYDLSPNLKSRD